mmetsp:Transcript_50128/g.147887  ORF Transcript_50128/g.147887 Transcript_50128/m.147887 type:complete len:132 (-) Transcript_50128:1012-1407(-)|eukprot:35154-Prymnesium_polylepis.1
MLSTVCPLPCAGMRVRNGVCCQRRRSLQLHMLSDSTMCLSSGRADHSNTASAPAYSECWRAKSPKEEHGAPFGSTPSCTSNRTASSCIDTIQYGLADPHPRRSNTLQIQYPGASGQISVGIKPTHVVCIAE